MMIRANNYIAPAGFASGYIAGINDGIVTALGKPVSRQIWVLDAQTMTIAALLWSLDSGNYIAMGLDPAKEYLVMVRDYKRELEPFAWDYVRPANDLTIAEQQALWQSWET